MLRSLSIAALLALGLLSTALPQDPGPGRPEDVLELVSADVDAFVEVVQPYALVRDWKEYVGAFCTKEGKEAICAEIEKALKQPLDMVPEKLRADFEKTLPTIQRFGMAATLHHDSLSWALIAVSADADAFKKLVDEDLKVFAYEERDHAGVKVQAIRKMGEIRFEEESPVLVANLGKRLVLTTDWASMKDVLDRAAGKSAAPNVTKSPLYARLAAAPAGPSFRSFGRLPFNDMAASGRGGGGRMSAHMMDQMDATMDLRRVLGITVEASLQPGKIDSRTRLHVEPPCRLFDFMAHPAGPRDLLAFVPQDAQIVVHTNLKGGAALWEDVKSAMKRATEIARRANPREEEDPLEEMRSELTRELGLSPDEIAAVIGTEAAFVILGDNPFVDEETFLGSFIVSVQTTDAEKARGLIERFAAHVGGFTSEKEGEATIWTPKAGDDKPAMALIGRTVLFGGKTDPLRAAIKASADGGTFAKKLPANAAGANGIAMIRHGAILRIIEAAGGGGAMAEYVKHLDADRWTGVFTSVDKNAMTTMSSDAGLGWILQSAVVAMPVAMFVGMRAVVAMGPGMMAPGMPGMPGAPDPGMPPADPPVLKADELAATVEKNVAQLRAEGMAERNAAREAIRGLGKQAIPHVIEAVKKEKDAEARESLLALLVEWKEYSAFPELLSRKVDGFVSQLEDMMKQAGGTESLVTWPMGEQADFSFPWGMEPYYANTAMIEMQSHSDVLEIPAGVKQIAERVQSDKLPVETARALAIVLAYGEADLSQAEDAILAAREKNEDPQARAYLQIALGSCRGAKAAELISAGFKDANRWVSRASFIGAERTKSAAVVDKLLELLQDADAETRWNASYTARRITREGVNVNVLRTDAEVEAEIKAAKEWWEKNRATFKFGD